MGLLISLDCLLQQMRAERAVDVYGVTLRLARSCCLMTPTLVGGKRAVAATQEHSQPVQGTIPCPLHAPWHCQPPRAKGTTVFARGGASHPSVLESESLDCF